MIKTLLRGLRLRCPNCGDGHISDGWFSIRETCPVCHVRFERKPGESTGANIITLSVLPIPALALAFGMMAINPDLSLLVVIGIPALLVVAASLLGYRHSRGLWIAVVALTDGLHVDSAASEHPIPENQR